jgi:hypothetical protein
MSTFTLPSTDFSEKTGSDSSDIATHSARSARTSVWATLSLMLGVVAALGALAAVFSGLAIAVGILAVATGIGGVIATSRPHIVGKASAFLGLILGLAGVALAVLGLTGILSWLGPDANPVGTAATWLHAHISWLFP